MSELIARVNAGRFADRPRATGMFGILRTASADALGATLFINLLSLVLPLTLMQVYDRIVPNAAVATLTLLVLGAGVALLIEAVLQYLRAVTAAWSAARYEHLMGMRALERVLSARLSAFEEQGVGEHVENFTALSRLKDFYAGQALRAAMDLPFALLFVAVVAYLGGWLALVTFAMLASFAMTAAYLGRRYRRELLDRMTSDDRRLNFIVEVLEGIKTVKTMVMEAQMVRRFERLQEACSRNNHDIAATTSYSAAASTYFSFATLFAVAAAGSTSVIDGTLSIGGLAACTLLSGRAMQPLQRAMGAWTRYQDVCIARERFERLLNLEVDPRSDGVRPLPEDDDTLVLTDVVFGYQADRPPLLEGVNLRVAPGKAIGIRSEGIGAGCSTLMRLMAGTLEPVSGTVRLGGHDISALAPATRGSAIAYLPSSAAMFKGTILENMTMFRPEIAPAALELSRRLGLDGIVAQLPRGYETVIGSGSGDALSRGVLQRIALVRGLATRPRVILFDEANSAIDSAGDAKLKTLLEAIKPRCGIVLVTHRPSLLKLADEVYELSGGRLHKVAPAGDGPGEGATEEDER